MTMINFEMLEKNACEYNIAYKNGHPFEVCVIDDFLTPEGLRALKVGEMISSASTTEKSSDLFFAAEKIENPDLSSISEVLGTLRDELTSDRFASLISKITGMKGLFVDPAFTGGGLHQGGAGSFLEMHADFSRHPSNKQWVRELNLLLYLNRGWQPEYGGCLDLRNSVTGEEASIEPLENRFVIMLTKGHTIHGYKKINFPPNTFRTSIAGYAYTLDDGTNQTPYRSTTWHPEDNSRKFAAAILNKLVPLKQKILGSRTAKRAKK